MQNFVVADIEITENVVLRKGGSLNLAYDKSRLTLGLNVTRTEDIYVESDRLNRTRAMSLNAKWRLSPLMTLTSEINWYELEYSVEQRTDKNMQLKAGVKVELNERSDLAVNIRRVERNSNQTQFDMQENRGWLSYAYRF